MSKPKRQYLVSTDSIGFLGRPEQFVELWKEYFDDKTLDGVEAVAFKPVSRLNRLIEVLKKSNISVLSFHGKTGGENRLPPKYGVVMTMVNSFIFGVNDLYYNFKNKELLFHTPYLENNQIKNFIIDNKPKTLWIENHQYGKDGIEEAIKQILFYRENKVNTSGMLDIFHYVVPSIKNLEEDWQSIVNHLESFFSLKDKLGKKIFTGIHFPIGTRLDDSLPIDDMTDGMLKLFSRKIVPHVERVVFENQQKNLGLFFSTDKMIEEQKARNKRIIERLKKTGIIC